METPRMYFSIHYENGPSSFQYEVSTPVSDSKTILEAIDLFIETTMEEAIDQAEEDSEE